MGRRFIDLNVHSSRSSGKNSIPEMMDRGKELGTDIRFCDGTTPDEGLEVCFDSKSKANKKLQKALYIIIAPNSRETFRWAVRKKGSIIRTDLSIQRAQEIKDKNSLIEVCLSSLVGAHGFERIRAIKHIKTTLMFARKFDLPLIVTTGATSIYGLRSPQQIHELLIVLGFTEKEAIDAMYNTPLKLLESGKERIEGRFVMEGVRIR